MCLTFVYSTATNLLNIFGDMLLSVRHTDSFVRRILQTTNRAYHKSLFPNAIGISITAGGIVENTLFSYTCLYIEKVDTMPFIMPIKRTQTPIFHLHFVFEPYILVL